MRALLDAAVLVPTVPRTLLLAAAGAGAFTPLWSARILEEWARAAARRGAAEDALARGEAVRLGLIWPDACVPLPEGPPAPGLWLPDPDDLHVLAAALTGGAGVIVTANLRDFPRAALAPLGLRAEGPDAFLISVLAAAEPALTEAADAMCADMAMSRRPLLRRAGLPRLGKALAAV